jgi:hypothetical protein
MATLKELKAQRQQLDAEIQDLEYREYLQSKSSARNRFGVQVACETCNGTGQVWVGGADIVSDPPYQEQCYDCEEGFRWMVTWDGPRDYSKEMEAVV